MQQKHILRLAKNLILILIALDVISLLFLTYKSVALVNEIGGWWLQNGISVFVGSISGLILKIVLFLIILYFEKKEK